MPPTLDTAQKVPPTLDTAQKVPLTLDIAQKVPPILDITEKVPRTLDTAQKVPAFLFVFVLFFVLSGSSSDFLVEPLCGCKDRETPRHLPIHLPPHLPTRRSEWSSRTMSRLEGNPSATSSGVAGSATSSSVEAGSAASSAPGSDDPVDESEPVVLQPPSRAETTISGGKTGALRQEKLTAWCWRFVSRFTPAINDKNVACLVKKVDGSACNHLIHEVDSSEGNKIGTGTSGMTTHIQDSRQAERNFSALAHLIGDLRSNMLASKVERRMVFIRLNRHLLVTRSASWTPRTHRHELG